MSNQLDNYFAEFILNGFAVIKDTNILEMFDNTDYGDILNVELIPDSLEYEVKYNQKQKNFLNSISKYIKLTYLDNYIKTEQVSANIWSGVDDGSLKWHCDDREGQDFCFLYYFDTMIDDGALHFKSVEKELSIYPEAGTLVWLNLTNKYLHKADRSNRQRRVMNLEFKMI